jgi:hypothetical protein
MSTNQCHLANTADYIIFHDPAGEVFAVSGRNNSVLAHGNDASTVIQKAIDTLPVTGGKIFISAGNYLLNSTLIIEDKHGVHIEGAARGIVFSGGNEGTVLRAEKDIDLVCVYGNTVKVSGITLTNFHLLGSGKQNGKAGLLVLGDSDLLSIHHVGANHCGIGFYLKGGQAKNNGVIDAPQIQYCDPQVDGIGMVIERCHYGKIIGGEFSDCDQYGIVLSSPDTGPCRIQAVKISSITCVRSGRAGILIGRNTDDITVTGGSDIGGNALGSGIVVSDEATGQKPRNIIISGIHSYNNRDAGILVEKAEHVLINACICSGHDHGFVNNPGQKYGIHIKPGAKNIVAFGNITYGNTLQDLLDETAEKTS